MRLRLSPVAADDFEALLALRVAAMRASLERIGRYEPARARERFAAQFEPDQMQWIEADGVRVGLLTVRRGQETLARSTPVLDAVCAALRHWRLGARGLKAQAFDAGVAIELEALKQSDANRFYARHVFGRWPNRSSTPAIAGSPPDEPRGTARARHGRTACAGQAITLLESSLPGHRAQADALLTACLPHSGNALRLGLSGVPGVGKSSFIEALGCS